MKNIFLFFGLFILGMGQALSDDVNKYSFEFEANANLKATPENVLKILESATYDNDGSTIKTLFEMLKLNPAFLNGIDKDKLHEALLKFIGNNKYVNNIISDLTSINERKLAKDFYINKNVYLDDFEEDAGCKATPVNLLKTLSSVKWDDDSLGYLVFNIIEFNPYLLEKTDKKEIEKALLKFIDNNRDAGSFVTERLVQINYRDLALKYLHNIIDSKELKAGKYKPVLLLLKYFNDPYGYEYLLGEISDKHGELLIAKNFGKMIVFNGVSQGNAVFRSDKILEAILLNIYSGHYVANTKKKMDEMAEEYMNVYEKTRKEMNFNIATAQECRERVLAEVRRKDIMVLKKKYNEAFAETVKDNLPLEKFLKSLNLDVWLGVNEDKAENINDLEKQLIQAYHSGNQVKITEVLQSVVRAYPQEVKKNVLIDWIEVAGNLMSTIKKNEKAYLLYEVCGGDDKSELYSEKMEINAYMSLAQCNSTALESKKIRALFNRYLEKNKNESPEFIATNIYTLFAFLFKESGDLESAKELLRTAIAKYGNDEKLGPILNDVLGQYSNDDSSNK